MYGPIIELLDCDDKFFTAVEVTAGNRWIDSLLSFSYLFSDFKVALGHNFSVELTSWHIEIVLVVGCLPWYRSRFDWYPSFPLTSLFHVVVENDDISTQIIRHLNSLKGGRVTFIPLNRVKAPQIAYPQSSDVIPLLKKLKFSSNYAAAFSQVVSRTIIYLQEWLVFHLFSYESISLLGKKKHN